MSALIDLTGSRYAKLLVLHKSGTTKGNTRWVCLCDCGGKTTVQGANLKSGHTKSCGCHGKEKRTVHAMSGSPEYSTWSAIKSRCNNKNSIHYKNYGGRGIKVCKRWRKFENFYADMGDRPTDNYSIERRDNEGNYEPVNCIWATRHTQGRNRRDNVNLEFGGSILCLTDWAFLLGVPRSTLQKRVSLGWSTEQVLMGKGGVL